MIEVREFLKAEYVGTEMDVRYATARQVNELLRQIA